MHRHCGDHHRYRLNTSTKVGQNRVVGDSHTASVGTLPDSVFVVCARRAGSCHASLQHRTDKLYCIDLLGQADEGIYQEAFRLAD